MEISKLRLAIKSFLMVVTIVVCSVTAQSQSIGIRAGLNYSKFRGPLQAGETFDFTNGFHFGFNYGYKITKKFQVRGELLYTQIGNKQRYKGTGWYKIYPTSKPTVFEVGTTDMLLDVSNAYINVPITAAFMVTPKIELFGGVSFNFLVNPVGRGNIRFESKDNPGSILFRQSLDYKYFQDKASIGRFASTNPKVEVEGDIIDLPRFAGAYYQYNGLQKVGSTFNFFDVGLTGGANYFINSGFFFGLHCNLGLTDVTNNDMDVSLEKLQSDNKFIYRDDKDTNLSFQGTIGFRF